MNRENKEKKVDKLKNDQELSNSDDALEKEKKNKSELFKRFIIRVIVVHLGIYILTAAYVISGAFLFQLLEKQNFIVNCQTGQGKTNDLIKAYRSKIFNYIYFNTTSSYLTNQDATNKLDTPNVYGPVIKKMLADYRDEILEIQTKYKYYGQDCFKENLWSFESSFLLTITIVSTLGYGHVTPATWEGQIVSICYATIGIPIFLMAVNNISTVLSDILIQTYSYLIGHKRKYKKKVDCQQQNLNKNVNKKINHDDKNGLKIEQDNIVGQIDSKFNKNQLNLVIDDENNANNDYMSIENDENDQEFEEEKVNVPLIIILIIFGSYLYIGAYGFTKIEKWTIIQAVYYAFISVSTIGLGDFVPGLEDLSNGREKEAADNLLIAIAFIFVGIAILGMCFKLIQETVKEKIHFVLNLLGITSDESKEIDENTNRGEKKTPNINASSTSNDDDDDVTLFVKQSNLNSSLSLIKTSDGSKVDSNTNFGTNSEIMNTRLKSSRINLKSKESIGLKNGHKIKPIEIK